MFTNHTGRARKAVGAALAFALVLAVSACGSGTNSSPGNDSTAGGADGTAHIRLANFGVYPTSAYLSWATKGGYFKKHGVEVELLPPMLNATDMLNAVTSGNADLAVTAPNAVAFARNTGQSVKIVATPVLGYPLEISFTPEVDKQLRAKGLSNTSPIKDRVAALKGMKLGVPAAGSSTDLAFRSVILASGLNPDTDIALQPMPDVSSTMAALNAKAVDGVVSNFGGVTTFAQAAGTGVSWDYMTGDDGLTEFPFNVMVASESFIKSSPDSVQRFLDALFEARAALVAGLSPEDGKTLKNAVAPDMKQELWDTTLKGLNTYLSAPPTTSDKAWDAVINIVQLVADKPLRVPASDAIDNTFAEKIK